MLSIPKISRCEHLAKTSAIIISIFKKSKLHIQINDHLKLAQFIRTTIFYYYNR